MLRFKTLSFYRNNLNIYYLLFIWHMVAWYHFTTMQITKYIDINTNQRLIRSPPVRKLLFIAIYYFNTTVVYKTSRPWLDKANIKFYTYTSLLLYKYLSTFALIWTLIIIIINNNCKIMFNLTFDIQWVPNLWNINKHKTPI